jgi:hypothetical protein
MQSRLASLKETAKADLARDDFIWHFLLQSFPRWGNSKGWHGLIGERSKYERVTFETPAPLNRKTRLAQLDETLREPTSQCQKRKRNG